MRLLALEAGAAVLGAALFEGGRAVAQAHLSAPQRQTEALAPLVRGLLESAAWQASSLGAIACGVGPGSFTGLRSSLAFGQGMALGIPGLALWGVATLEAWAEAFCPPQSHQAWVLLDGRRGQAYRGAYRREGARWAEELAPALLDLDAARPPDDRPILSDRAELCRGAQPVLDSPALALAVGRLALAAQADGQPDAGWDPRYLRRSEAEILWERLHPPQAPAP
jgi:tRNA threonylcarbamoyladenosine biosynthesis protein TsaB